MFLNLLLPLFKPLLLKRLRRLCLHWFGYVLIPRGVYTSVYAHIIGPDASPHISVVVAESRDHMVSAASVPFLHPSFFFPIVSIGALSPAC